MATKLYPPQIAGTLPAFYKTYDSTSNVLRETYIKIPFTESAVVGAGDFVGFMLRLKTASTGTYLFEPVESTNYDAKKSEVIFTISAENSALLHEGQYYKVQLAYISSETVTYINTDGESESYIEKQTGYFSTVGIIKCVPKPNVYIRSFSMDSINLFNNEMFGVYEIDDNKDKTEKVYSYNFSFYTEDNELYYTTGEILHNTSNDSDYGESVDKIVLNSFIKDNEIYKLAYTVTTVNGLVVSSPYYRITAEALLVPSKSLYVLPEAQPDVGGIKVRLRGLDKVVKKENVITSLRRAQVDYDRDRDFYNQIKFFYWGQNSNPAPSEGKIEYWVNRIMDGKQSTIIYFLQDYRQYLKDNLNLSSQLLGITTGLLESLIDSSLLFCTDYGTFLKSIVNKPENAIETYDKFILKVATYILTTSSGYNNLVPVMQTRVDSYNDYIIDMIRVDPTEVGAENTAQDFKATCQTIITTCDLEIETAKEYLKLLKYNASIELQEELQEEVYFGQYILARASEEDNYATWLEMKRFKLENLQPSLVQYDDWTVKQGVRYIYSIQQYNVWGLYSSRIVSKEVSVDFEDIFLYDGERSLKVRFNPKVSSFKTTLLEQKTNTIGNKYPFIFRNGKVSYKEFPLSGLVSFQMDNELLFYDREIKEYYRTCTENKDRKNSADFLMEMDRVLENPCDLIENNIHLEREFKLEVLDWLNDGKPKIFRSGTEGNYIIRIMNVSMSPMDQLGRMLHTFNGSCVEIADFTYENLLKFGFIKADVVSKYVSLWKTYYLNEYPVDKDIEIEFESNVEFFSVQDLMPGTNIYITYGDTLLKEEETITIGITGAYAYSDASRPIAKIRFPNIQRHQMGILEVQYKGVRYSDFDAIVSMSLKTILSNQYIGVNPDLLYMNELLIGSKTERLKKAVKSINSRLILNETASAQQIYNTLKANNFEPGDIVQHINTSFYNHTKNKLRILNLEQLKIKTRELIPIYAVPYDLISDEGWARMPDKVQISNSDDKNNSVLKDVNGRYPREVYERSSFPAQSLLYSVTPFGEPYPIDELSPLIREYYDVNDEFCVFHMMEYNTKFNTWMPTERKNFIGVRTAQYYDCYWNEALDEYDTTYYVDEKYRYDKLNFEETQIFVDENGYYLQIGENKKYFGEFEQNSSSRQLDLYVNHNGKYVLASSVYVFPKTIDGYYTVLTNDDSLITEKAYLDSSIRWRNKEDNHSIDNYYNNSWTPDENKKAASIVRSAEVGPFYLRQESLSDLQYGEEVVYRNLSKPEVIKIGTGLIAEATFQLEVLDYFTESNVQTVKIKKDIYINLSNFLKNLYKDFEILSEADAGFQKYLTLSRAYRTLLEGLTESNNRPYSNTNTHANGESEQLNYQDRRIIQEILNIDRPNQDKLLIQELADLWDKDEISDDEKQKAEEYVKTILDRLKINKYTKSDMNLLDTEEEDLVDLITSLTKDGIAAKKTQIDEVIKKLTSQVNASQVEIDQVATQYEIKLSELETALNNCNNSLYGYHAQIWLYTLILHYLRTIFAKTTVDENDKVTYYPLEGFNEDVNALHAIDDKIKPIDILTMIKNHYDAVLAVIGVTAGTMSDETKNQVNFYRLAWDEIHALRESISVNQSIIDEKERDESLDDFLTEEIKELIFDIFYQYQRCYIARRNINKILGVDAYDTDSQPFAKLVCVRNTMGDIIYTTTELDQIIANLKSALINKERSETFEDINYSELIQYMNSTFKNCYNNFINLLNSRENVLTDEDKDRIIEFIQVWDTFTYVRDATNIKGWKCILDGNERVTFTLNEFFDEEILEKDDNLITKASQLQQAYKQTYEKLLSDYIKGLSSTVQAEILNQDNRKIIYEQGDTSQITVEEFDIFNSQEFDGPATTTLQKTIKAGKISALLNVIKDLSDGIQAGTITSYIDLLDQLSETDKYSGEMVNFYYEANKALKEYNKMIGEYQLAIINKTQFDKWMKVTCKSAEHLGYLNDKYYTYNDYSGEYKQVLHEEQAFDENATYYIKLRDLMIYDFLTYYNSLILEEGEKEAVDEVVVNSYISNGTGSKIAKFDEFKIMKRFSKLLEPKYDEITKDTLSETYFFNDMINKLIGYTKIEEAYFNNMQISGDASALTNESAKINQIITALRSLAEGKDAIPMFNSDLENEYLNYIEKNLIIANDQELNYYANRLDAAKAIVELQDNSYYNTDWTLFMPDKWSIKYQIISCIGWLVDAYYAYNVSVIERAELSMMGQEMYTKTSDGNEDIITRDWAKPQYGKLTKVGITYWYLYTVLNTAVNELSDLIDQANTLSILYTNKFIDYTEKQAYYSSKYKEYIALYLNYISTDVYNYYMSSINDKDAKMRELIESVKDAWYEFILALDVGFTKEIEAGMYQ